MDEIELLVEETYKHYRQNFEELEQEEETLPETTEDLPNGPGVIYHIQKTSSIFVIRTFVSKNINEDYQKILEIPEDYPTLRLVENGNNIASDKLRFFLVENPYQAEIIHDQLNNRRFPVNEEILCNISDPGFSWWLTKRDLGFQISFTMSVGDEDSVVKLGPLGDQQLALRNFQILESLMAEAGLSMNIQNEINRVQIIEGEEFLLEELRDLFEFGVVSEMMLNFFKLLNKRVKDMSALQTAWFYLQEIAAMRRFWIQVQYDLNP
ncbi:MAG: hypothetical protein AB7I27_09895 [Bacteriovoracaceae bacterium]